MAKKIKVFLGGYVNFTNAQNLNCRALAKYLNKDKFECAAMFLSVLQCCTRTVILQ